MHVLDYVQDLHTVQESSQTFVGITEQLIKRINDQQSLNVFYP